MTASAVIERGREHWRESAARLGLQCRDLSSHVGSEIGGLGLGDEIDAATAAMLRAACADRTVLLFRDQDRLTPAQYLGFAKCFGERFDLHSLRHYCLPEHHEIFVVGNVEEDGRRIGATRVGLNWHTDHYHLPQPALFTFLHALVVPPVSGETTYANGMAAYDALPTETKARIDKLQVLHSRARLFRALFPEASEEAVEAERKLAPDVVHPLVRTHPELGRRGLYLGGEWGSTIMGLDEDEAQRLFQDLVRHLIRDEFTYKHSWRPGDVLMSDNRCSVHRASEWDEDQYKRRLHRITLFDNMRPT